MGYYVQKGTTKIRWLTSPPATLSAPTVAEINAGVNLDSLLNNVAGLTALAQFIDASVLADRVDAKISGTQQLADTTLTFLDSNSTTVVRTALLTSGTAGYLIVCPLGIGSTRRCRIWPAETAGLNDVITVENAPAKFTVGFGITLAPTDGTIA